MFNLTGVTQQNPQLATIGGRHLESQILQLTGAHLVDYAAAVAYEIRASSNGPVIRFLFKNGTTETDFTPYHMFGADGDVALSDFVARLSVSLTTTLLSPHLTP